MGTTPGEPRPPRQVTRAPAKSSRLVLACLFLLVLASCARRAEQRPHGHSYTLRGEVTQLPDPGSDPGSLSVHHEPVDDLVDRDGRKVGMDSMVMPFPLARGVTLDGVAVGDPIAFTLRVDWQADPEIEIVAVRKLAPGTRLSWGTARPGRTG
ncbi:MAG: copper-binding protein [Acidobacteriota bacterium]|nr:copper-binding protein [Acidobacteriota bacterium]